MAYTVGLAGAALLGAGGLAIAGGIASLWHDDDKRDLSKQENTVARALIQYQNTRVANMSVLNGMLIQPQEENKAVFRNEHFYAEGNITLGASMNGFKRGTISISMDDEHVQHGKWIVIDTSDGSNADHETVASFDELHQQIQSLYGEGPVPGMLKMLEILSSEG